MNEELTLNRSKTVEIDLIDMFWAILAHWRSILACTLILAIVFGAVKGGSTMLRLRDVDFVADMEETNRQNQETYEIEKAELEGRLQSIMDEQKRHLQEETSYLFAVDPYQAFFKEASYYVSFENEYSGEESPVNAIITAYGRAVEQLNAEELLAAAEGKEAGTRFDSGYSLLSFRIGGLDELLSSSVRTSTPYTSNSGDGSANGLTIVPVYSELPQIAFFTVKAIGANEAQANALMEAADQAIRDAGARAAEIMGAHRLTLVSECQYQGTSQELINIHRQHDAAVSALNTERENVLNDYENLKAPGAISISPRSQTVKYFVLGAVIGLLLSLGTQMILFVSGNRLSNPEELKSRYNAVVLGVLPEEGKALLFDRWIAGHRGLCAFGTRNEQLRFAAANIRCCANKGDTVLLAGSCSREKIEALSHELQSLVEAKLLTSGSLCREADAIEKLLACDHVILVEEIDRSTHREILEELFSVQRAGKKYLGFLLTGCVGKARQISQ